MRKTGVTVQIVSQYNLYIPTYLAVQKNIRVTEDKIIILSLLFFTKTSTELLVTLTDPFFFPGGWWWLWCVVYHCWGKSYHIPHLQQILLSQHCKINHKREKHHQKWHTQFIISESVLSFVPCCCLSVSLCDVQESRRFGQHISKAMLDIKALFEVEQHHKAQRNEKQPQLENGKNHMWQLLLTLQNWTPVTTGCTFTFQKLAIPHCQTKREVFIYLYVYVGAALFLLPR